MSQTIMPEQKEHEKIENLVDAPGQAATSARSLGEAADSNGTLQGYYAINDVKEESLLDDDEAVEDDDLEDDDPDDEEDLDGDDLEDDELEDEDLEDEDLDDEDLDEEELNEDEEE